MRKNIIRSKNEVLKKALNKDFSFKTNIYLCFLFTLFPLFLIDYSNVTVVKYNLFLFSTLILIGCLIFSFLGSLLEGYRPKFKIKSRYNLPYMFLICFVVSALISCFLSPYKSIKNPNGDLAFLFGSGRYDGFIVLLLYIMVFFIVSKYGTLKQYHLVIVAVTLIFMSIITIVQSFGVDIFNLVPNGSDGGIYKFASTIGNIDLLSGVICLFLPLVATAYLLLDWSVGKSIILLFSVLLTAYSSLIINVSSGFFALGFIALIMLPILLKKGVFLNKLLLFATSVIFAFAFKVAIKLDYIKSIKETHISFELSYLLAFLIIVGILLFVMALFMTYKSKLKNIVVKIKQWYFVVLVEIVVFAVFLIYIYFYGNTSQNTGFSKSLVSEIYDLLHGNITEKSGTNRIGNWIETLKIISERPIFGMGMGSFSEVFAEHTNRYNTAILDNPHNEYLNVLFSNGFVGLFMYLGFLLSVAVNSFKKLYKTPHVIILGASVLCYLIQAFFSFSIVIVAPIFWVCIALLQNATNMVEENVNEK